MTYYVLVCPIGAVGGKNDLLTYSCSEKLTIGQLVHVPYGKQTKNGVVWGDIVKPAFKTKPIEKVLDEILPQHLIMLAEWIHSYYATRLPMVLQTLLPSGAGRSRKKEFDLETHVQRNKKVHALTTAQKKAVKSIEESTSTTHLLHGVTGSGKTQVYLELAKKTIEQNKSVILLVPEIALTSQLASDFTSATKNLLVLHSQQTEAQRHSLWKMLQISTEPWVIIGPRSSLFAPLKSIGLIIIDECHEPSYVQDSQPKYNSLRVARKLADIHKAKLVLGSATPNIADYYLAQKTNTPIVELLHPIQVYDREVTVVDSKDRNQFLSHPLFSKTLIDEMLHAREQSRQILLFHNRRGTARLALCSSCGWLAECSHCHVPLRLHHDTHILKCHICGVHKPLPPSCPECNQPDIEFKGFGSKRIEQEVAKLLPDARIARFDSDTPQSEQIHMRYNELFNNEIDVIIGTQGLAKGLDLPKLSTIGIVQSDTELFVPDFSSAERAFQIITQVIGRAGRTGDKAKVIIQTLNPDHFVLKSAIKQNYEEFYASEIKTREMTHLPPFTFLLQLRTGYATNASAEAACTKLAKEIKKQHPKISVRGPAPSFHNHQGGKFYWQMTVSSQTRATLVDIARNLPQRWQFTLDPMNLL